jgi:uncharacterized protein
MKNVLLDTWAVLALLYAEEPAATRIRSLLYDAGQRHIRAYLTLINLGEIYYTVGKRRDLTFAQQILAQVRALPVEILLVDEALVMQAATYKKSYAISYADAFALAASVQQGATLVTGDVEFKKLQALFDIELL